MMPSQVDRASVGCCKAEIHTAESSGCDLDTISFCGVSVNCEAVLGRIDNNTPYDVGLTLWTPAAAEIAKVAVNIATMMTLYIYHCI